MTLLTRRRPWARGMFVAAALVLGAGAALTWGPHALRGPLARQLSSFLGHPLVLGRISVRPWAAELRIDDLSLRSADGAQTLLKVGAIKVQLDLWASLRHRAPVLDSLSLHAPVLHLTRSAGQTLNLSPLLTRWSSEPSAAPGRGWRISQLSLHDGTILASDQASGRSLQIAGLDLTLTGLSDLPAERDQAATLVARWQIDQQPFKLSGQAAPFAHPAHARGQLSVANLALRTLTPYLALPDGLDLAAGQLSLNLSADWQQAAETATPPSLSLAGTLGVQGLQLWHPPTQTALNWEQATLVLAPSPILPHPQLHVRELVIAGPAVRLTQAPPANRHTAPAAPAATLPALRIDQLALRDGSLQWRDAQARTLQLDRMSVQAKALTLSPALSGQVELSALLDQGTPVQSSLVLGPTQIDAQFAIDHLDLARAARWLDTPLSWPIERGQLSAHAALRWETAAGAWRLRDGAAHLEDLALRDGATQPLAVRSLRIKDVAIDSRTRHIATGELRLDGAQLALTQAADGSFPPWTRAPSSAAAPAALPSDPWSLAIGSAQVRALDLTYRDARGPAEPTLLQARLALTAAPLQWPARAPIPFTFEAALPDGSALKAEGRVRPAPLDVQAKVALQNVALAPLRPYLESAVKLTLTRGALWGSGQLSLQQSPDAPLHVGFRGGLSLNDFLALDPSDDTPLLRWSALVAPQIDLQGEVAGSTPWQLELGDMAWVDFYSRLIISPEGRLNVMNLLAPSPDNAPAAEPNTDPAPPPIIRVGTLRVAGGQIDFTDEFIRPSYSAYLSHLSGAIEAGSSDPKQASAVLITGHVDGDTPLEITGSVQALSAPRHLDIRAIARSFDLPKLSAYSGRWAGYAIEKGKLSADIRYAIQGEQLSAQNRVTINQLTLGEKVDSPDATPLPVRLAVALLKDRAGNIDLDLPISGTVSDPEFSVGSLIGQALRNLLIKTVSAPFTLLSGLAGGGAEGTLNQVDFAPGLSELDEPARQRLDRLAQALQERPGLAVEVIGHADPLSDRQALAATPRTPPSAPPTRAPRRAPPPRAPIADEELKTLAQQRATVARDYLRSTHGLSTERLWLLAPRLATSDNPAAARRTEFRLQ